MPSIGWLEILIIVSIAIIVVGPKDFPYMLKKIGSWIGTAKRYVRDVQGQVSDLTNETLNTDIDDKPKSENKEKQDNKNEDIYSDIDEMLNSTLKNE